MILQNEWNCFKTQRSRSCQGWWTWRGPQRRLQTRYEWVSQPHPAAGKAWIPLGRWVADLYSDCEYLNTLRTRQVAEHLWWQWPWLCKIGRALSWRSCCFFVPTHWGFSLTECITLLAVNVDFFWQNVYSDDSTVRNLEIKQMGRTFFVVTLEAHLNSCWNLCIFVPQPDWLSSVFWVPRKDYTRSFWATKIQTLNT